MAKEHGRENFPSSVLQEIRDRTDERVQWVKVLCSKTSTHMVEEENQLHTGCYLNSIDMPWHVHP